MLRPIIMLRLAEGITQRSFTRKMFYRFAAPISVFSHYDNTHLTL